MSRVLRYTEEELRSNLDVPKQLMEQKLDKGNLEITLLDGSKVKKKTRQMIMLLIGLRPHLTLKVPLNKGHFNYDYTGPKDRGYKFDKVWTPYYRELLEVTKVDHHTVYKLFAESVNYLSNMIVRHLGQYQQSMSILSLSKIQCHRRITPIVNKPIVAKGQMTTDIVEKEVSVRTKKLIELLATEGAIKNNVLLTFMWAGALKKNQIPQQMIAYGARSDIDDTMMKNIIQSSAISGLQNVTEYAIEGLSVKKSEHYKKSVIRDSQYSARGARLNCAILPNRYVKDCGSKLLLPYVIPEKSAMNYIDKVCYHNGKKVFISEETLPDLIGKTIQMVSPLGCKHPDGICERCAGRATSRPWAFIPDVHLGIYAATKVGEAVSQMVLSAKHLIKTLSIVYELIGKSEEFFEVDGTNIKINPAISQRVKGWKLKVPIKFLGHVAGRGQNIKFEESFNDVDFVTVIKEDDSEIVVPLANDRNSPFFSSKFLNYIRTKREELVITNKEEYIVPLDKFNLRWPIMKFNIINDDMVSYTKACDNFIKNRVSSYTTATSALHDFASVIYSKSSINIFYLEILLRTMMRKPGEEPGLPLVDDFDNVRFEGICKNISTHTLSQKLVYERIGMTPKSDGLLSSPQVSLIDRNEGLYDILLFGHMSQ